MKQERIDELEEKILICDDQVALSREARRLGLWEQLNLAEQGYLCFHVWVTPVATYFMSIGKIKQDGEPEMHYKGMALKRTDCPPEEAKEFFVKFVDYVSKRTKIPVKHMEVTRTNRNAAN